MPSSASVVTIPTTPSRSPTPGRAACSAGQNALGRSSKLHPASWTLPRRRSSSAIKAIQCPSLMIHHSRSHALVVPRGTNGASSLSGKGALKPNVPRSSKVGKTRAASETGSAIPGLVSWESNARTYELAGAWDWSDLRYGLNVCYLLGVYATVQVFKAGAAGGFGVASVLGMASPMLMFFVAVPVLESLIPGRSQLLDPKQVAKEVHGIRSAPVFAAIERLSVVAHVCVGLYAYSVAASVTAAAGLSAVTLPLAVLGAFSLGVYGITINAAMHDLVHSRHALDRWAARAWLSWVFFAPYSRQHVAEHHGHGMSRADFTTAGKNLSYVAFLARYVMRHFACALSLRPRPFLEYVAAPAAVMGAVFAAFGPAGLILHISQGLMVIHGLCTFDYILHYGLHSEDVEAAMLLKAHYEETEEGTDETGSVSSDTPIAVACTWADRHVLTKLFSFNVISHAHHHFNPKVPGSKLVGLRGSPVCPLPLALVAVAVPVPWLYRAIMHPVLEQHLPPSSYEGQQQMQSSQ